MLEEFNVCLLHSGSWRVKGKVAIVYEDTGHLSLKGHMITMLRRNIPVILVKRLCHSTGREGGKKKRISQQQQQQQQVLLSQFKAASLAENSLLFFSWRLTTACCAEN